MTANTATYFVVVAANEADQHTIYDIGTNAEQALEDAKQWATDRDVSWLVAEPCSEELYDLVKRVGTPRSWGYDRENCLHVTEDEAANLVGEQIEWSVFDNEGNLQGTEKAVTARRAVRNVLGYFGTVLEVNDTWFTDSRVTGRAPDLYHAVPGNHDERPEDDSDEETFDVIMSLDGQDD